MKLTARKFAVVGASAAMLALLSGPAYGAGVNVTYSSGAPAGGRTLTLQDTKGNDLTTAGLDLSSGSNNFIAKVVDTNYADKGFTVEATMSNLYEYDSSTGNYTCGTMVPSSAVTLSSPGGLEISGVGLNVTPNFILSGSLPAGSLVSTLDSSNGQIQGVAQTLTQSQILGAANSGTLYGTALAGVLSELPVQVSTPVGGPFTSPAADPPGASCGVTATNATPTSVPVMTATTPAGLLTDVQNALTSALNGSPATVANLITAGYLDPTAVQNLLLTVTGLPLSVLQPLLPSLESTLTGALNSVTPVVPVDTTQSGTYSSDPAVAVNTSGIGAGSYKGLMTITLMDS